MYIRLWRWLRHRFRAKLHSLTNMNGGLQSDNSSSCIQACKWGPQRAIWNKTTHTLDVMWCMQAPTLCRHLLPHPQDRTWNLIRHPGDEGSTTKSSSECFNDVSHISLFAPHCQNRLLSQNFLVQETEKGHKKWDLVNWVDIPILWCASGPKMFHW